MDNAIITTNNKTLVAHVKNPCNTPTRLEATPATNPPAKNARIIVITVQIRTPVPTPARGSFEEGSTTPNPIALPIKNNKANVAKNVTTPAITDAQDTLNPASPINWPRSPRTFVFVSIISSCFLNSVLLN